MKNRKIIKSIISLICVCAVLLVSVSISALVSSLNSDKFNFEQFASWQAEWGTLDSDKKITWAEGKTNLVKGMVPSGRHALSEFNTANLSFNSGNGSAKGLTDESLNNVGKGWFQFNAAGNPDKEPTTYPWRFTFNLGSSSKIEEILIITHETNNQVMLNSFEIYVSDDLESLYSTPAITVEKVGNNAKGYYSLKAKDSLDAKYVGLSVTDFNLLTNADAHNSGVLLLRELAILGSGDSATPPSNNMSYYSEWQSAWGTLDSNKKITWADGKTNLVKGMIPSGNHSLSSFNPTNLSFTSNGSAAGLTDESLNNAGKGWFQFNAANNQNAEPTTYPWRFTFNLGSNATVEEILLITHETNAWAMINSYEIYVSDNLNTLYTSAPVATVENVADDMKGYHALKLEAGTTAKYVGLSVTDFNYNSGSENYSGMLTLREFAVLGTGGAVPSGHEMSYYNIWQNEWGSVDSNLKITWADGKINLAKGIIPLGSNLKGDFDTTKLPFNKDNGSAKGITDENLSPGAAKGWFQFNADGNANKESESYPWNFTFDLGSNVSIEEILLMTHETAVWAMINSYEIYISDDISTLYSGTPVAIVEHVADDMKGYHSLKLEEGTTAKYVGLSVTDFNHNSGTETYSGILTLREFAVLGKKGNADDLIRLHLKTPPTKTEYLPGDKLDLTGISLSGYYADGSEKPISIDKCTVSGYDANKIGNQLITVNYSAYSTSFYVTVSQTGVVCSDADVTDEYLLSLGKNHLNGKKMQLTNSAGKSFMTASYEDARGIYKPEKLTDGSVTTDSKDLVRIRLDTAADMPCAIIYDMSQSISINQIAVVGHVSPTNDFQLSTYRIYAADSRDGLISDENLILSYDNKGKWNKEDGGIKGSAQVFGLAEKPKGRFIAFVFDKNNSTGWGESRQFLRELGVYGEADLGKPTNLLANTIVSGNAKLNDRNNLNILSDNDYGTEKFVDFEANGKQVKLLYDLGAGKNLTEFRLAGASNDVNKLINEFKIYAAQTQEALLNDESLIFHYVRKAGDIDRTISYILPEEKDYQYVAFVIEPAKDGSCMLSEVAAIGLSWQLNRIENLLFLSNSDSITAYIEDKTNYALIRTNTFAQRDNPNRADMSAYIVDGNIGDVNVSLFGATKGKETNNLLIDLEYSTLLNEVDVYGIMHESLYNAKKISVYIGESEQDVWGKDAKPVASYTDAKRSGSMEIKFSEVIGRFIRICVDEGADASVCHGSDLAVISEISANGMSFNTTNSVITMPSFTDEKTGITLEVLPLNYRDYYDTAVQMRVTLVDADEALACSLKDFGLRLSNDKYYKIELLDKNGKVISDLGGRKAQISVPVTEEQQENLIYLALVEDGSLVLTDSAIEENQFTYICENDMGTILLGFAEGYYYEDEEDSYYDDEIIEDDFISSEDLPSDDTEVEENNDGDDNKKPSSNSENKKPALKSKNYFVLIIAIIGVALILAAAIVLVIIIIKKRRKGAKNA